MIVTIRYFSGSESKCCTFSRGCNFELSPQKFSNSRSFAWKRKAHSLLRIAAAILGGAVCPSMDEKLQAFKIETWLNYETPQSSIRGGHLSDLPKRSRSTERASLRAAANSSSAPPAFCWMERELVREGRRTPGTKCDIRLYGQDEHNIRTTLRALGAQIHDSDPCFVLWPCHEALSPAVPRLQLHERVLY